MVEAYISKNAAPWGLLRILGFHKYCLELCSNLCDYCAAYLWVDGWHPEYFLLPAREGAFEKQLRQLRGRSLRQIFELSPEVANGSYPLSKPTWPKFLKHRWIINVALMNYRRFFWRDFSKCPNVGLYKKGKPLCFLFSALIRSISCSPAIGTPLSCHFKKDLAEGVYGRSLSWAPKWRTEATHWVNQDGRNIETQMNHKCSFDELSEIFFGRYFFQMPKCWFTQNG